MESRQENRLASVDNLRKDQTCFDCLKYFDKAVGLYRHFINKHNWGKRTCELCKKSPRTLRHIYFHNMKHRGLYPWECKKCGLFLRNKDLYKRHMEKVHKKKESYTCEICYNTFIFSLTYKAHVLSHDRTQMFECAHCSKRFAYKITLERHLEMDGYNFCRRCKVDLPCKTKFNDHNLERHSGDKLFKCTHCDNSYKLKSSLVRHVTVKHLETSKKLFNCTKCNYVSNSSANLNRHKRTKHKN